MPEIFKTADGSNTLFSPEFNEHYHSTYGALNESMQVYIENGLKYCKEKTLNIFELGFGTGLNAILTYIESIKSNLTIKYNAIELYPVKHEVISGLDYREIFTMDELSIFNKMHNSQWNTEIKLSKNFILKKIESDFDGYIFKEKFDLIFFDAFAPETQPNLWSKENFLKVYNSLNPNGILTTYSSKGIVKRNLRDAGFVVSRLPGPNGKRHVLRAEKKLIFNFF
ncbi:MAG: tRNA (5-methylaminomethyl-2-thiouridine)(34)-methyltransferase MnmD [Bacteroidales bacterium]|nr:tRNA (5-methylaminomethyl-2-thiouridine)(34)-methyltransferase MnmD [Bacteroidales bacterium]